MNLWPVCEISTLWAPGCNPVSQEISPPGKNVAATKFPRINGRSSITERPYFLGIIIAPSKFRRC